MHKQTAPEEAVGGGPAVGSQASLPMAFPRVDTSTLPKNGADSVTRVTVLTGQGIPKGRLRWKWPHWRACRVSERQHGRNVSERGQARRETRIGLLAYENHVHVLSAVRLAGRNSYGHVYLMSGIQHTHRSSGTNCHPFWEIRGHA